MIKVLNLSLFVVLSRSLQHQIKRKIGVSSANMVDYNKFQYIDIEGESIETSLLESLVSKVQPIESAYDTIKSGGYKVISIGEASHGTEEFYRYRCDLTKKLIKDGLCQAVLIEGDLPDCAELHRYVTNQTEVSLDEAMDNFTRFPAWMWRNKTMKDFLVWLRAFNLQQPDLEKRTGIFGLDVYSLYTSMVKIIEYLNVHDPEMAKVVKQQYSCFDRFEDNGQFYGMLVSRGVSKGCRDVAVKALRAIAEKTPLYGQTDINDGIAALDSAFINEMNALVVVNAEEYYRTMFDPLSSSWNIRDSHFFETIRKTREHLLSTRGNDRVVVWAHNSHLGDARYTHLDSKAPEKELNVGQLIKENYGAEAITVGQLTYNGFVTCADNWDEQHQFKTIRNALPNSYEELFHMVSKKSSQKIFTLDMRLPKVKESLDAAGNRLQRAIGVIYRPQTERQSHYYYCDITGQFDIVVWNDHTNPVIPLDDQEISCPEPETYPSGL